MKKMVGKFYLVTDSIQIQEVSNGFGLLVQKVVWIYLSEKGLFVLELEFKNYYLFENLNFKRNSFFFLLGSFKFGGGKRRSWYLIC